MQKQTVGVTLHEVTPDVMTTLALPPSAQPVLKDNSHFLIVLAILHPHMIRPSRSKFDLPLSLDGI
jgi:hypothetical protein